MGIESSGLWYWLLEGLFSKIYRIRVPKHHHNYLSVSNTIQTLVAEEIMV